MTPVKVTHFSDVLCVWAYVGQASLYRLAERLGDRIGIELHFCSVFPDAHTKIGSNWKSRGGFDGYASHVREVAGQFPGTEMNADTWSVTRPLTSASPHLFLKAVELIEEDRGGGPLPFADRLSVRAGRELRRAFFAEARDIARWDVQREVAARLGLDFDAITERFATGEAVARLTRDYDLAHALKVEGSPTWVLNEGRQKLFGNVSYGIVEANMKELLEREAAETASLC